MRQDECHFLNIYGALKSSNSGKATNQTQFGRGIKFGIVQLDFDDFYRLMQLKIQYQRQSISQQHFMGELDQARGMGSVDYAAATAYGQRLSQKSQQSE